MSAAALKNMNMIKLFELFPDDDACRAMLELLRWPNGVACIKCGSIHIRYNQTRSVYDCGSCGHQFTVISGTIFHDTHLPIRKWMVATYLMCESKKGISANQMKRTIAVSYKTAWYLCHRIRAAMTETQADMLMGVVEVDETWVGGKQRGVGRGNRDNKQMVVGAVQRGGEVRLEVGSHATRKVLHGFIHGNVSPDAEAIYTDEWAAYKGIGDADTVHESVNHSADEWVRGKVHTQTVEGVWSLLKRSIVGSYHKVSIKHLDAYLNELEWRFNNRQNEFLFRDTLVKMLRSGNLEYKELVNS